MLRAFIIICLAGGSLEFLNADEAAVGRLRFNLPDGYRHQVDKGIDTAVGSFRPKDGDWEIRYDIGSGAGRDRAAKLAKRSKETVVEDKMIQTELGEGRLVAVKMGDGTQFAAIFEAAPGVILYAVKLTKKQLADFSSIAESIRLTPEPKGRKPEAEQPGAGQPATKPADKTPVKDQPSNPTSKDGPR